MLSHKASGRSAPFAKFAAAAAEQDMPQTPVLKQPKDYRLMGTDAPRFDIPAKVNGTASFIDAKVPGETMSYAAVRRVPVPGTSRGENGCVPGQGHARRAADPQHGGFHRGRGR